MSRPAFQKRAADLLWAGLAAALAAQALADAWSSRDVQGAVYFALHLQAAVLFLSRSAAQARSRNLGAYAIALASTLYVYLYRFEPADRMGLALAGEALTLLGSVMALAATQSLGRFYGVLPIARGVQTRWLYQVVRHPVYASYLVMDVGILLSAPSLWNTGVFLLGAALFLLRIGAEERVLDSLEGYQTYRREVRFRLISGLY